MRYQDPPARAPDAAYEITRTSALRAPAPVVWAHASSMAGVNRELFPLARMTHPREARMLTPETVPLGRRAFRSWVLLFGVLPVDYDDLTLVELEPGRRFLECSPMLTQREWRHERTVVPTGTGCTVTDRVRFRPRVPWLGPLQHAVFRFAFWVRHRNLRRRFGDAS